MKKILATLGIISSLTLPKTSDALVMEGEKGDLLFFPSTQLGGCNYQSEISGLKEHSYQLTEEDILLTHGEPSAILELILMRSFENKLVSNRFNPDEIRTQILNANPDFYNEPLQKQQVINFPTYDSVSFGWRCNF